MFGSKSGKILLVALCLALISCSAALWEPPMEQWPELLFSIDGKVDIQLRVPPADMKEELSESQFISTVLEPTQNMFFALYDPGNWSNRGLLLTTISGTAFRLESNSGQSSSLILDDIKNDIYLSRPDASKEFDISGKVTFNDRQWLRINLIGGHRSGISYATVVGKHYAFILSLSVFGEDSDQTRLFQTRHETLKQVINSVRIWPD